MNTTQSTDIPGGSKEKTLPKLVYTRIQPRGRSGDQRVWLSGEINVPRGTTRLPYRFYSTVRDFDARFRRDAKWCPLEGDPTELRGNGGSEGPFTVRISREDQDQTSVSGDMEKYISISRHGQFHLHPDASDALRKSWDRSLFHTNERIRYTLAVGVEIKNPQGCRPTSTFSVWLYAKPTFAACESEPPKSKLEEMDEGFKRIISLFNSSRVIENHKGASLRWKQCKSSP